MLFVLGTAGTQGGSGSCLLALQTVLMPSVLRRKERTGEKQRLCPGSSEGCQSLSLRPGSFTTGLLALTTRYSGPRSVPGCLPGALEYMGLITCSLSFSPSLYPSLCTQTFPEAVEPPATVPRVCTMLMSVARFPESAGSCYFSLSYFSFFA